MDVRRRILKSLAAAVIHTRCKSLRQWTLRQQYFFKMTEVSVRNIQTNKLEKNHLFEQQFQKIHVSNPGDILLVLFTAPQGKLENNAWQEEK